MTTTTIPDDIRAEILEEAGPSANAAVTQALTRWESGDQLGALRLMYEDGADRDWLFWFARKVGIDFDEAKTLAAEATR